MTIAWSMVDIIGLLADRTFLPPASLPTTLSGWIGALVAQLGENFKSRYHVDPNYADAPVTANDVTDVTGKKCGEILRWVCQASGTWPRADAETGDLTAEPPVECGKQGDAGQPGELSYHAGKPVSGGH